MNAEPPAIIEQAPETDAQFRAWVRDEFKHTREQLKRIGEALDTLLKMAAHDEKQHEVEHG